MNVLLLSQFFSITRGGGEYVFHSIAKKLAENGHNVFVITNKIKNEKYLEESKIKLIFVPPTLEYKGGLPPTFSDNIKYTLNAVRKGRKIIKTEEIDLIHSNNFAPALAGSILSQITSKPHITTIHDIFSLGGKDFWKKWGEQSDISKLNVKIGPFFEKILVKLKHNCIHTVSEATKDDLIKFGVKKPIYVIPNFIQNQPCLNLKPNRNQFIFVGRLVFYKNLEVVLKAIKIVKDDFPEIKLIIVGDGPFKNKLQELVKKLNINSNVKFTGYISNEEKSKLISESNALVFPSLFEGFGLVMLESFAQKRPVIVSNVRPMSDIILNKETGFVVDPFDEELWGKALKEVIENPSKSDSMGEKGYKMLQEKYNQDLMYQKLEKMYHNILEKKSR